MRLYSKRRFHQAKPSQCLRCVEASSQSGWTKAMVSIENVFYLFCAPIKCLTHLWRSKIFVASPCDLECLLLSSLFRKFQHVPLPDLCPKWLVVTAPWGSYLPRCTKTKREPVYPLHPSATGCCGLLSYIL